MYKQITANKRKTVLMMIVFVGLVAGMSWLFGEYVGTPAITPYILIGSFVYVLLSYLGGSRLALAMNGAQEIKKIHSPRLWRMVENLAITEGLPMPRVFMIDDRAANAFATGRDPNHSVVCVTTGLMDILDDKELEGVLAHEMGHIKNYDIRVSMIAFALVAVIGLMADILFRLSWFSGGDDEDSSPLFFVLGIAAAILAPVIATLIQLAISRKREYLADATGALATRYPAGLASALAKIGQSGSAMRRQNTSTAHLFFASPLRKSNIMHLFSTHPPIEERIKRLTEMDSNG